MTRWTAFMAGAIAATTVLVVAEHVHSVRTLLDRLIA